MKNKNRSNEEYKINQSIESGDVIPVHVPRLRNSSDILKYQLCSEVIRYKKENDLRQNEIALAIGVNKSEISKMFSYQLDEFSTDRLLLMVESLIKSGADISLEDIFNKVKKKLAALDKKMRSREKMLSKHPF